LSSKNRIANIGWGNATYIYATNVPQTRSNCDWDYNIFNIDSYVNYNLATRSWAIVMVSWNWQKAAVGGAITLTVTYNGDSSAASSIGSSPIVLAVAAVFAMVAHRIFGF